MCSQAEFFHNNHSVIPSLSRDQTHFDCSPDPNEHKKLTNFKLFNLLSICLRV